MALRPLNSMSSSPRIWRFWGKAANAPHMKKEREAIMDGARTFLLRKKPSHE
jgi:hypothetical protein